MKLNRLHLWNFRCFDELIVDLHPKLTVFVAENGTGKTAILDAIAMGFGRYLTKLGVKGRASQDTDLRVKTGEQREAFMVLGWETIHGGQPIVWASARRRNSAITATDIKNSLPVQWAALLAKGLRSIDEFANQLVGADLLDKFIGNDLRDGQVPLPVVAYYGTNRAIRDDVQRRRSLKKKFRRFDALADALEPDSRFQAAFEWFNVMEDQERREKEQRRNFDYRLPELECVREAIKSVLGPPFDNPRTEILPLRFVIDQHQPDGTVRTLRISQLSDGYRVVLGLVMDLARRMTQANPQMMLGFIQSALNSPAIALIDEIDLHLHPSWQQRVLMDLQRTFPNTQFIVTTHSPQVLTSVDAACIRKLEQHTDPDTGAVRTVLSTVTQQTRGVASADVLAEIMGVDPIPDVPEARDLSTYHGLIQQNLHESDGGKTLRSKLDAHFGPDHPVMLDCNRMIRLQTFKQKLPLAAAGRA